MRLEKKMGAGHKDVYVLCQGRFILKARTVDEF